MSKKNHTKQEFFAKQKPINEKRQAARTMDENEIPEYRRVNKQSTNKVIDPIHESNGKVKIATITDAELINRARKIAGDEVAIELQEAMISAAKTGEDIPGLKEIREKLAVADYEKYCTIEDAITIGEVTNFGWLLAEQTRKEMAADAVKSNRGIKCFNDFVAERETISPKTKEALLSCFGNYDCRAVAPGCEAECPDYSYKFLRDSGREVCRDCYKAESRFFKNVSMCEDYLYTGLCIKENK